MTPDIWVGLAGIAVTLVLAMLGGVIWLVRLEGKVIAAKTLAAQNKAEADKDIAALQAQMVLRANAADDARVEIVRLQEQIKHLTDMLERYFIPAAPRRKTVTDT